MAKKTEFDGAWAEFQKEADERADELSGAPLKFEVGVPVMGILAAVEVVKKKAAVVKGKKIEAKEQKVIHITLPDGRTVRYWTFGLLDYYLDKFKAEVGMKLYIEKLPKKKMADGNSAWGLKFYQKGGKDGK